MSSKADKIREAQEKFVRESLTRAMNEVREARRTGKKLQSAQSLFDEFLNELD